MELEMNSIFLAFKISNAERDISFEINTSFYFKTNQNFICSSIQLFLFGFSINEKLIVDFFFLTVPDIAYLFTKNWFI